jgi:signal transduction histidine kinase/CheY-like chemotaxis protein
VNGTDPAGRDQRVLLLAPTSRDAALARALLSSAAIPVEVCASFRGLVQELGAGAAAILIPEEAVSPSNTAVLCRVLAEQPPWSDLPVLVLARSGADSLELNEAARTLGNVTLLERPLRVTTLLSAVRTALRARDRQYQIRGHLSDRARAEEALRAADQRKDEFLATLGHELRNPLAPLLTGLKLLRMADLIDPDALRALTIMERQVGHLIRLVDDLLEVSRITRGVIDVQREPLDLALVVRAAIDTSRPALEAARHELTVDIPAEPITVVGDSVRLTQVFANLLTNAAKYTNDEGHIWLTVARQGARATVSVRDDGIGLAPAQIGSVFDMFTQVDRSGRRAQGGLGIGLTLVRSLVALHGGRVEARSAGLGAGSEFEVELPVVAGRQALAFDPADPRPLPPRRILVVDDNRDAADTLGALLTALGATVSVVHSGREALASLDSFDPDTVLLDIGMPGLDGYEVSRRIRATPGHRHVTLIALTGWGQEHDQRGSRDAGFDHHLVKPPDVDRLREILTSGRPPTADTAL